MEQMTDQMVHYETLYVVHPVHGSKNNELKDRFQGVLESQGANVTHFEEWGLRDLAYPIQKQGKGYYNLIQFMAAPGATAELERVMRLTEEVMRYLTVALDEDVRPLAVVAEPEPAEAAAASVAPVPVAEESKAEAETQTPRESTDPAQS